jgi:colanic acid/amylovoran biosynthesis glycosyltransferase
MPNAEKSKIAYLVNQYPQASHTFIRREIAGLESLGIEVERYTVRAAPGPSIDPADESERLQTQTILGVGLLGLWAAAARAAVTRPLRFARALGAAVRLGRRSERGVIFHLIYLAEACVLLRWLARSKAVHLHAHFGTNSTAVAMLCRLLGGPPYSFTAHGPEEFDFARALSLGEKVRHAEFVVAVSEFGKGQLYRWSDYADWGKIHVIRCGVDAQFLDAGPPPIRTSPRLVCVGRLAEQKGQLLLVEAAGLLRQRGYEFQVSLVGDGPMRKVIEQRIEDLGLEENIILAGWGDTDAVRRAIIESRALVLPSLAEGLPVVLMEALALGRPVISTYIAGIPELVTTGVCGWLVPSGSVDALADAMASALSAHPDELQRMGLAGAARIAVRHDARLESARLAALLLPTSPTIREENVLMRNANVAYRIVAGLSLFC